MTRDAPRPDEPSVGPANLNGPSTGGSAPVDSPPVDSPRGDSPRGGGSDAGAARTVEAMLRQRLEQMLGGWRGAVEAALPTVAFVVVWTWRQDLRAALLAAGVAVLLTVALRLAQRQTVQYALSSVFVTAVAAVFALRSGRAEDAFLPGILWNLALGVVFLVSVLVRWPAVGFVVAAADPRLGRQADDAGVADDDAGGEDVDLSVFTQWRAHEGTVRVAGRLTLVLAGLFLARVAIMLPMYLAGDVALLGVAKLVLSWPAYVAVIALLAAILARGHTPLDDPPAPAATGPDRAHDRP